MATILFVEDEAELRALIAEVLVDHGHVVELAEDGPSAIRLLADSTYDFVVSDVSMPGGISGIELAELVHANYLPTQVILVSGHARAQLPPMAPDVQFLPKPYRFAQLLALLSTS